MKGGGHEPLHWPAPNPNVYQYDQQMNELYQDAMVFGEARLAIYGDFNDGELDNAIDFETEITNEQKDLHMLDCKTIGDLTRLPREKWTSTYSPDVAVKQMRSLKYIDQMATWLRMDKDKMPVDLFISDKSKVLYVTKPFLNDRISKALDLNFQMPSDLPDDLLKVLANEEQKQKKIFDEVTARKIRDARDDINHYLVRIDECENKIEELMGRKYISWAGKLGEVLSNPFFRYLYTRDNYIYILCGPSVITEETPGAKYSLNLGHFVLQLSVRDIIRVAVASTRYFTKDYFNDLPPDTISSGDYDTRRPHPHIVEKFGRPCFGALLGRVNNAIDNYDLITVMNSIQHILCTYNPNDSYVAVFQELVNFYKKTAPERVWIKEDKEFNYEEIEEEVQPITEGQANEQEEKA